MRRSGPTNVVLRKLITRLKKEANRNDAAVWKRVAELLSKPARRRPVVNLSRIQRYAEDGETIVVPGKVLGAGTLTKKVTVAAQSFSEKALLKISAAGGRAITIEQLLQENPKGSGVRVMA